MPATSTVTHYGVHWAPGKLAYLHQGRGATNAVGVREPSPFEVRTARRWMCNHLVALNAVNSARGHLMKFEEPSSKNPLVRFMLPVPKGDAASSALFRSEAHERDLLQVTLLLKMSSLIKLPVFWANVANTATLVSELGMTNLQPLMLAGVGVEHTAMARDVCREAALSPPPAARGRRPRRDPARRDRRPPPVRSGLGGPGGAPLGDARQPRAARPHARRVGRHVVHPRADPGERAQGRMMARLESEAAIVTRLHRWGVLRIKKTGGVSELVAVHEAEQSAKDEAGQLASSSSPYRFTVMPVSVEMPKEHSDA